MFLEEEFEITKEEIRDLIDNGYEHTKHYFAHKTKLEEKIQQNDDNHSDSENDSENISENVSENVSINEFNELIKIDSDED